MTVKEIQIYGFKGIEQLIIRPGNLTVISGDNGEGKSSVLQALQAVVDGGHNPQWIRRGQDKATIVWTLDNGVTIEKIITPTRSTLTVTDPAGNDVPAPQSFVTKLCSGFAFDPLELVTAKPKERAAFLLSALPIEFSPAEIFNASGQKINETLTLDRFDQLSKRIYDERAGLSKQVRDAEGTLKTLTKDLPTEDEAAVDWQQQAASVQAKIEAAHKESAAKYAGITEHMAAEIEEINRQAEEAREQVRTSYGQMAAELDQKAAPELAHLNATLGTIQAKGAEAGRIAGIKETIEKMRTQIRTKNAESAAKTKILEALEKMKAEKLSAFALEGIAIQDGEILVNGLPFDELNTAQQYQVCFQIASLKTGPLGLMIADRGETFSKKNWQEFAEAAATSGFQVLLTRVSDEPLKVEAR